MAILALTRDGVQSFNLDENKVLWIVADGTGSKVTWQDKDGGVKQELTFDETPAAIEALADRIYPVDLTAAASADIYIQAARVINVEGTTEATIAYNVGGALEKLFDSVDPAATVVAELNALL